MTKNIVVVGGGTAGWLTALTAKKKYPKLNVTVIESKDIGILGAGEGSTPYLPAFLKTLNIGIEDLVKNCDLTIKNGIKFTGWNRQDDFYNQFRRQIDYLAKNKEITKDMKKRKKSSK